MKNKEVLLELVNRYFPNSKHKEESLDMYLEGRFLLNAILRKDFQKGKYFFDLFGTLHCFFIFKDNVLNMQIDFINVLGIVVIYEYLDLSDLKYVKDREEKSPTIATHFNECLDINFLKPAFVG